LDKAFKKIDTNMVGKCSTYCTYLIGSKLYQRVIITTTLKCIIIVTFINKRLNNIFPKFELSYLTVTRLFPIYKDLLYLQGKSYFIYFNICEMIYLII